MILLSRAKVGGAARTSSPIAASRPFLLWYLLGLAWGCAHVGMEFHAGDGLRKVGVPLSLTAIVVLVFVVRGQRWALPVAVVLGAVESYYVAVAHFVPARNTVWLGPLPWLTRADVTSPGWSIVYKVLIEVGLVIGLAVLWTGVRALIARFGQRTGALFIVACAGVMLILGHSRYEVNDGLWGFTGLLWMLGIAMVPFAAMALSSTLYIRSYCPTST